MAFFEVPLLLNFFGNPTRSVDIGVYGGIAWGLRARCRATPEGEESQPCGRSNIGFDPQTSEWTVPFGVTVGLAVGRARLFLDARYSLGLTNLSRLADTEMKTGTLQFLVRLMGPLP